MNNKTTRIALAGLGIATLAVTLAAPASAHVTGQTYGTTPTSGGYGQVFLRVPHGCDGDATNIVDVAIPSGVTSVKAQQIPGWDTHTTKDAAGNVTEVRWSGGSLSSDNFQDFGLTVKWPTLDADEASRAVYFKTVQTCNAEVTVKRAGRTWTATGVFPDHAGQQVGVFVGPTRVALAHVDNAGHLVMEPVTAKIGTDQVTVRRGGVILGNSVAGEEAWVNVPAAGQDPHSIDMPAPSVTVVAAASSHH